MIKPKYLDISVGIFILMGFASLMLLVFKVSGINHLVSAKGYNVSAEFTDIGGLKVRAPVTVSGVRVGEVVKIELQPQALSAIVTMKLNKNTKIPYTDSSARILTEGILGANYISIIPGFEDLDSKHPYLRSGDVIAKTQEAIILENIIGQLVFNINKK